MHLGPRGGCIIKQGSFKTMKSSKYTDDQEYHISSFLVLYNVFPKAPGLQKLTLYSVVTAYCPGSVGQQFCKTIPVLLKI